MIRLVVATFVVLTIQACAGTTAPRSSLAPARVPDIGFEATSYTVVEEMLKLARVKPSDIVFDLGSGDGRIVNMAAMRYGARGVGIELQPYLVEQSRRSARESGISDRVTFITGDIFKADISRATVVMLYLWPSVDRALETKLKRELRPGTRIVSHSFDIGNWVPRESIQTADGTELYLWTVPRRPRRVPDVPFLATPQSVVYQMLDLAHVRPADIVFDLGSGDGRIPIIASQRYGARGVGIEIDPSLVESSMRVAHEGDLDGKVIFHEADLLSADVSTATVVTLYLSDKINARLERKLKHQLRPGTRIVSHKFAIGTWRPDKTVTADDGTTLLLWTIPPRSDLKR
jgi:cyclopropane fatty-acyl-phospholipid synthase-like methyltransferase